MVFCLLCLATALVAPPWPAGPLILCATWLVALVGAHIPGQLFFQLFRVPAVFLFLSVLSLCVSVSASDGSLLSLAWSAQGVQTAQKAGLRALGALSATLTLAICIPLPEIFRWLRRLHIPDFLLEFTALVYRMIFVMEEARQDIQRAQEVRLGYSGFRNSFRSLSLLATSLFLRSQQHAMRLERGLESRTYDGTLCVLSSQPARISWLGLVAAILAPVTICAFSFWFSLLCPPLSLSLYPLPFEPCSSGCFPC